MAYDAWKTRSPDDEQFRGQPYGEMRCDTCDSVKDVSENEYSEFVCESCEQNATERAWERHCEAFHGGGGPLPLIEQQRQALKLK